MLNEYEYPSEIEQQAVESVRDELIEQLEYWNNELNVLPPQQNETETKESKVKNNVMPKENILANIQFDVGFALLIMQKQLEEKKLKSFAIKCNRVLFDTDELAKYLSETIIQKTALLEDIIGKAVQIIKLYNNDFLELEKHVFKNLENHGSSNSMELITIIDRQLVVSSNSETAIKHFYEGDNLKITPFVNQHFAYKCDAIINRITAFYPSLKSLVPEEIKMKTEPTEEDLKVALKEIGSSDNKFLNGMPMQKVVEHFAAMNKRKNKNGDYFLTDQQLISFLKKGFLSDSTQPKQKINCSNGEKGFVIKRFYEFFDLAVSQYSCPSKIDKFILLFTDCFDNWEQNTIRPFFKSNKTKNQW